MCDYFGKEFGESLNKFNKEEYLNIKKLNTNVVL